MNPFISDSRWYGYWDALIKPAAQITSKAECQRARLLASFLIIVLILTIIVTPLWAFLTENCHLFVAVVFINLAPTFFAYFISRTRYFYISPYIFITALTISTSFVDINAPTNNTDLTPIFAYFSIAIVTAGVFLQVAFILMVAALCIGIIVVLLATWQAAGFLIWHYVIFLICITTITLVIRFIIKNYLHMVGVSESRYTSLFNQSHDAVFLLTLTGEHMLANQRAADMLGYSMEEIQQMSLSELSAEIDASENIRERLLKGDIVPLYERKFRKKDGSTITVEISAELVRDEDQHPIYIQSVVRDIQARKAAELALAESENRYRSIVTSMTEGIIFLDKDGQILACNDAAEKILGRTQPDMRDILSGSPAWEVIREDGSPFPTEAYPAVITLQTGSPQRNVVMGVFKPNGDLVWLSINTQPLQRTGETQPYAVVISFTDITERKHLEETVRKNQSEMLKLAIEQERVRVLRDFMRDASHEFRTPLAIINTSLHLVPKMADLEKQLAQVSKGAAQIQRITHLLDSLLALVTLDGGEPLKFRPIHSETLLKDLVCKFESEIARKPLHFTLNLADLPLLSCDSIQLLVALTCIIENAVRFTPAGGHIQLSAKTEAQQFIIQIADTGIGIAQEDFGYVFERFWRKDVAHTTPGMGLGLALAQKIIHLHHGSITLSSELGQGSIFTVTLPIAP
jgi:PAS domain S-box-containing protein